MPRLSTATVGFAVAPTVVGTFFSHYLNRKPPRQRPTAHLSYHEGLCLIRAFLEFASHSTVEDVQVFTAQWVPHPTWVRVEDVEIPEHQLKRAADAITAQLGPDIGLVGGREWWQWREPGTTLKAEWIEMWNDYDERKETGDPGSRVILFVHGGAYYFGSVDEHRFIMQRLARKLKGRVFAPAYRLAPQFPFPAPLQDCLAAYLHLLTFQEPRTVVLAGDSAGGGMIMSMLVTLRDRGLPLPAGAVLISPWCDLTHSFPSVAADNPFDYVPAAGFHHRPSRAWPPPNEDDLARIRRRAQERKKSSEGKKGKKSEPRESPPTDRNRDENAKQESSGTPRPGGDAPSLPEVVESSPIKVTVDGKDVVLKDQVQMYAPNHLIAHPLVSPILQPTLGGLPPLLIIVGGGEMLRDEQIYLAHKCADPEMFLPPGHLLSPAARAQIERYEPTDVQVQVWDNLCHVAPTLSFTRPAKHIYRSMAQFSAWALAKAQKTGIEILADDSISVISSSDDSDLEHLDDKHTTDESLRRGEREAKTDGQEEEEEEEKKKKKEKEKENEKKKNKKHKAEEKKQRRLRVGKAGDPLPRFRDHMIRQRVTRHGFLYDLEDPSELPGCTMPREQIGTINPGVAAKWLAKRAAWDARFTKQKEKVHEGIVDDMAVGLQKFGDGEVPPPSALAGRRRVEPEPAAKRRVEKGIGMSLWSLWGSKHDKMTVARERKADRAANTQVAAPGQGQGQGARSRDAVEAQVRAPPGAARPSHARGASSRSWMRTVTYEQQTGKDDRPERARGAADESRDGGGAHDKPQDGDLDDKPQDGGPDVGGPSARDASPPPGLVPKGVTGKRALIGGIAMPFSLGDRADTASMFTLQSEGGTERAGSPMPPPLLPSESTVTITDYLGAKGRRDDGAETVGSPATPAVTPGTPGTPLERYVTASEN